MAYLPPFPGRDELLTMALVTLGRERGVHDMSIRTLAAAVRAAPGSLTYHHHDKEAMLARSAYILGGWLSRDMDDRMSAGGLAALLPDPRSDDLDELEYCCRLRVWAQLRAYGLSAEAVGASVDACDAQMQQLLTSPSAGPPERELPALGLWAVVTCLATALLRPGTDLTRDRAVGVLVRVVEPETSTSG